MDSPLSENRPNLLVYVAAGAAVLALILGMMALYQIKQINTKLGSVDLADLDSRITSATTAAANASTAASTANTQNNPAIKALSATMQRAIGDELTAIRTDIQRVEELAKQATSRPAPVASSGGGGTSGGSSGPTVAPGSLDADGAYVIKSGDTFGKIAPQFGVTVADIVAANPGVDPRRLRVGQKIIIPQR